MDIRWRNALDEVAGEYSWTDDMIALAREILGNTGKEKILTAITPRSGYPGSTETGVTFRVLGNTPSAPSGQLPRQQGSVS